MNTLAQSVGGLSPIAQVVLIVCLFALAIVILMIVFMMIVDSKKMQTATKGADQVAKLITRKKRNK